MAIYYTWLIKILIAVRCFEVFKAIYLLLLLNKWEDKYIIIAITITQEKKLSGFFLFIIKIRNNLICEFKIKQLKKIKNINFGTISNNN